jgi:hypothetical protein
MRPRSFQILPSTLTPGLLPLTQAEDWEESGYGASEDEMWRGESLGQRDLKYGSDTNRQ